MILIVYYLVCLGSPNGGSVAPGDTFTYHWSAPALWANNHFLYQHCFAGLYHSAVDPEKDVHTGLVGPILLCRRLRKTEQVIIFWFNFKIEDHIGLF